MKEQAPMSYTALFFSFLFQSKQPAQTISVCTRPRHCFESAIFLPSIFLPRVQAAVGRLDASNGRLFVAAESRRSERRERPMHEERLIDSLAVRGEEEKR